MGNPLCLASVVIHRPASSGAILDASLRANSATNQAARTGLSGLPHTDNWHSAATTLNGVAAAIAAFNTRGWTLAGSWPAGSRTTICRARPASRVSSQTRNVAARPARSESKQNHTGASVTEAIRARCSPVNDVPQLANATTLALLCVTARSTASLSIGPSTINGTAPARSRSDCSPSPYRVDRLSYSPVVGVFRYFGTLGSVAGFARPRNATRFPV